jgi:hypothetical protein
VVENVGGIESQIKGALSRLYTFFQWQLYRHAPVYQTYHTSRSASIVIDHPVFRNIDNDLVVATVTP